MLKTKIMNENKTETETVPEEILREVLDTLIRLPLRRGVVARGNDEFLTDSYGRRYLRDSGNGMIHRLED